MKQLSAKGRAALRCAQRGWPVFPVHTMVRRVCTCKKVDCRDPGKHPLTARGFKDASTDLNQIRAWWREWPDANVAVATGCLSGLCVLDVDARKGGKASLQKLLRKNTFPPTPTVKTGGNGLHYYFRFSQGVRRSKNGIRPWYRF